MTAVNLNFETVSEAHGYSKFALSGQRAWLVLTVSLQTPPQKLQYIVGVADLGSPRRKVVQTVEVCRKDE